MIDPHGYSIAAYGDMIADRVRTDAYAEALRAAVTPDSIVLDIGAGAGILSLLACRYGARHVYAVEPNDSIEIGRQIAAANGYADRITFIQDVTTNISLPQRANVVVGDIHGVLPLFGHMIPSLVDARARLLAPGGALIPCFETLWVAVVEAPGAFERLVGPWDGRPYDLDMAAGRDVVVNTWTNGRFDTEQLLTAPRSWGTLDYAVIEVTNMRKEVTLTVNRAGTGHGLALWFDSTYYPGVERSNAPGQPRMIYGQAYFPWPRPIELAADERVTVEIGADLVGREYVWRWNTSFSPNHTSETPRTSFRQSTFFGVPLSLSNLQKHEASFIPRLRDSSAVECFALGLMDGTATLAQIAERLAAKHPDQFPAFDEALAFAGDLCEQHCR